LVQVYGCYERAGLNGKEETLKPGVVYDGIIAGESDFVFLFYIDGSFRSNFQPRAKIFRFLSCTRLLGGKLFVGPCSFLDRFQPALTASVCSPVTVSVSAYPMPHRCAHALRCAPYFRKQCGMNMNVSKCGSV